MPLNNPLFPPKGSAIYYQGPDAKEGTLPAVLFFALSAQASLFEDPFNQPVLHLIQQGIRVFSWDLPFHELGSDPNEAIRKWAYEFMRDPTFIFKFLETCQSNIDYLLKQKLIDVQTFGVAGLSRGGLIATHLAAYDSRIKTVLGFAPLTQPQPLEELKLFQTYSFDEISLVNLVDRLTHVRLRFYIGNHDTRVGTDACYQFIDALTKAAFNKGIRSPTVELVIYPSIGHKGHGTPSAIFYDGADWIKKQLTH